jgi:hypothetical protein
VGGWGRGDEDRKGRGGRVEGERVESGGQRKRGQRKRDRGWRGGVTCLPYRHGKFVFEERQRESERERESEKERGGGGGRERERERERESARARERECVCVFVCCVCIHTYTTAHRVHSYIYVQWLYAEVPVLKATLNSPDDLFLPPKSGTPLSLSLVFSFSFGNEVLV